MRDPDQPNLGYCDPDEGGCGTRGIAPGLLSCPHCQRELADPSVVDESPEAAGTVDFPNELPESADVGDTENEPAPLEESQSATRRKR